MYEQIMRESEGGGPPTNIKSVCSNKRLLRSKESQSSILLKYISSDEFLGFRNSYRQKVDLSKV